MLDSSGTEYRPLVDSYGRGNGISGSVKREEFPD